MIKCEPCKKYFEHYGCLKGVLSFKECGCPKCSGLCKCMTFADSVSAIMSNAHNDCQCADCHEMKIDKDYALDIVDELLILIRKDE